MSNPKIVPVWNSVVEKIEGDGVVENLVLKNVKTGELSNLKVAGVFMFVGQTPDDDCVRGLVKAEKGGWILVNEHMETSVEGIFAAGDVCSKHLRQVITAASDGAIAAWAPPPTSTSSFTCARRSWSPRASPPSSTPASTRSRSSF